MENKSSARENYYFSMLGIDNNASADEIKKAYRIKCKNTHPDLFPEHLKNSQKLKMMKLNEAYMAINSEQEYQFTINDVDVGSPAVYNSEIIEQQRNNLPGKAMAPDYAFYKTAFNYYSRARSHLNSRKELGQTSSYTTNISGDKGALRTALKALREFEQAFIYFLKIVENHPESIWIESAKEYLDKIESQSKIYNRICQLITERSSI